MALLDLDDNDLAVLNQALMQAPYGVVAPLINKINEQLMPKPTAPTPEQVPSA